MYATLVYAFVSSDLDFLRHINTLTYLLTYLQNLFRKVYILSLIMK